MMSAEEIVYGKECVNKNKRDITEQDYIKLEEQLRIARSDLIELKELIIKLLFDRYGH